MSVESSVVNTAIFKALCSCLGLSANSPQASAMIRPSNLDPENAPKINRTQDVIYYDLFAQDDPDANYQVFENENPIQAGAVPAVSTFASYNLTIVCYGPGSESNARKIRNFIFLDGNEYPRSILRRANIYLVSKPANYCVLYEEDGALWRKRTDLVIQLRIKEKSIRTNRRDSIEIAPAVIIRR